MIRRTISAEPMPDCERQAAEALLANLIARAYSAYHPDLFPLRSQPTGSDTKE